MVLCLLLQFVGPHVTRLPLWPLNPPLVHRYAGAAAVLALWDVIDGGGAYLQGYGLGGAAVVL